MTPLLFVLTVAAISLGAGFLGSLLGLGGGMIVVPALTLFLHVDIRLAIGASIISVIATSSGAAAAYVRDRLANLRVAMFLDFAPALGLSDVPDPYYGSAKDFEHVLDLVEQAADGLLAAVKPRQD